MQKKKIKYALLIKNTFKNNKLRSEIIDKKLLTREDALKVVYNYVPNHFPKISTTGVIKRALRVK